VFTVDHEARIQQMLIALGPGGTRDLAERALAHADTAVTPAPVWERMGGLYEVAALCDRSRAAVSGWATAKSSTVPAPKFKLEATPVWDLLEWLEYGRANPDKMGPKFDPLQVL
jgi:hypothetical protein